MRTEFTEFYGAEYLGETDDAGVPLGRGTLRFPDGTTYTGTIRGADARGRGVWQYPDGSRMTGGFTVCRDDPVFTFTDADGTDHLRVLRFFVTDPDNRRPASPAERTRDRAADACASRIAAMLPPGLSLEFNARALLADEILSRALSDEDARALVLTAAQSAEEGGILRFCHAAGAVFGDDR